MSYLPEQAVAYAQKWAFARNPRYANFDAMGGDCTNFISQCLYAGCGVMNNASPLGWYYYSLQRRAAAWSGVPFLYNFLTNNQGAGPFGAEAALDTALPGDIIQLSFDGEIFAHSLLVIKAEENISVATHTQDAYERSLASYSYARHRLIHILGARE